MKMSKKVRILSVLLCIAVMVGIMSVGMMANAANSLTPAIRWADDIWHGGTKVVEDGIMSIDLTGAGTGYMFQVGTNGGASRENISELHTADGAVFAIRIDEAQSITGNPVVQLAANLKLFTSDRVCYNLSKLVDVGGPTTQVVLPLAEFYKDNHPDELLPEELYTDIVDYQFEIRSDFEIKNITNNVYDIKYTISPIYAYTGEAERIKLPGDVDETTTEPTTAEPTTEAPTTVAPTTEVPTTALAATTTAPAIDKAPAKPAKVKGVVVKAGKKRITVKWNKAKNAKKYRVKYSYKKNMKKAKFKTVRKTKVVIKKLKAGKKVYVQVQGINGKLKGKFSKKVAKKVK